MAKNQIILKDVVHEFVQDKPTQDCCYKCSLQQVCYEKFDISRNRDFLCSIFTDEEIINGHFETKGL